MNHQPEREAVDDTTPPVAGWRSARGCSPSRDGQLPEGTIREYRDRVPTPEAPAGERERALEAAVGALLVEWGEEAEDGDCLHGCPAYEHAPTCPYAMARRALATRTPAAPEARERAVESGRLQAQPDGLAEQSGGLAQVDAGQALCTKCNRMSTPTRRAGLLLCGAPRCGYVVGDAGQGAPEPDREEFRAALTALSTDELGDRLVDAIDRLIRAAPRADGSDLARSILAALLENIRDVADALRSRAPQADGDARGWAGEVARAIYITNRHPKEDARRAELWDGWDDRLMDSRERYRDRAARFLAVLRSRPEPRGDARALLEQAVSDARHAINGADTVIELFHIGAIEERLPAGAARGGRPMRYAVHVDTFSGALADLPAKARGDDEAVLACLRDHPRFSVFDAIEHASLAKTLDRLGNAGRLRYLPDTTFPWVHVEVLPPPLACGPCDSKGSTPIIGKHCAVCTACGGKGFIPAAPPPQHHGGHDA